MTSFLTKAIPQHVTHLLYLVKRHKTNNKPGLLSKTITLWNACVGRRYLQLDRGYLSVIQERGAVLEGERVDHARLELLRQALRKIARSAELLRGFKFCLRRGGRRGGSRRFRHPLWSKGNGAEAPTCRPERSAGDPTSSALMTTPRPR